MGVFETYISKKTDSTLDVKRTRTKTQVHKTPHEQLKIEQGERRRTHVLRRVSSSCSTCCIRRVPYVKIPLAITFGERGRKVRIVVTTSGTHSFLYITQIFCKG